ncbi:hypothetical protein IWQ60_011237 [Tieghemiomyces parasiticus]|uniref:RING-type domain-containing protein n=1 Tax=Tieghemiomyces parasiticus TaxID=78921 RepID=A0A9W7ZJ23_9FUNG|nr:hypothetical protein IWQ60_011237 [Tieghemiomyces parasiticus]
MSSHPFPLLAPVNRAGTEFRGFLTIKNEQFPVHIHVPDGNPSRLTIRSTEAFEVRLAPHRDRIKQRLSQCQTIDAFWHDLRDILEETATPKDGPAAIEPVYLQMLLANLERVGWEAVESISSCLLRVTLRFSDPMGRVHAVHIQLPPDFPRSLPSFQAELPETFILGETEPEAWFQAIVHGCQALAKRYQPVWAVLDEIDRDMWVLEPRTKRYATLTRRVALEQLCSVELTLDPQNPRGRPAVRLYGPDTYLRGLRARLRPGGSSDNVPGNLTRWDSGSRSFRSNLQSLLGVDLPASITTHAGGRGEAGATEAAEFMVECGICYAYQLKDHEVPDQLCPNPKCHRPFHRQCLVDWLRANPSTRQSLGILFGECPYCSEEITTTMAAH